jgi:3-oxoacyl-[acyl-carrier protein] reductase
MDSETRHAVITGGTGSLGRAVAAAFQESAWTVAAPGSAALDVRDPAAVRTFFHAREVDLLVCAAGITRDAPMARLSPEAWDETWSINYRGALDCANAVLPGMIARHGGHILFISSHSALHPPIGQAAYAAAKAALLGLVTDLARRHGSSNIRVNAILPGFLDSRMTEPLGDARRAEVLAAHTLGRLNTCDRVAAFIHFLHHELPHTSGQVFQLDSR